MSNDRGRTWQSACLDDDPWTYYDESPAVAFNADGQLLAMSSHGGQGQGNDLMLRRSTDGGRTWPVVGRPFLPYYEFASDLHLRLDVGERSPYRGRLYAAMATADRGNPYSGVSVATSSNGGGHWLNRLVSPQYDYFSDGYAGAPDLAIGRSGTLYVSYSLCTSLDEACVTTPFDVLLVSSADGGTTWSAPRPIQKMVAAPVAASPSDLPALPNTNKVLQYRPVLAVDTSSGAYKGRLYSVVSSHSAGRLQILLSRSDDGGATWSPPAAVAPVAGSFDQFQPSVQVSAHGKVAVSWLDRRNDPGNVKYQPMAAVSTDGGLSFSAPLVLDQHLTDPNTTAGLYDVDGLAATVWAGRHLSTAFFAAGTGANKNKLTLRFSDARP